MKRKLVFWTAWNSYQSEKCLAGKPSGTVHPTHKAVIDIPGLVELPAGRFCVTLHDANTSSGPEMRYVLRNKPMDRGILKREFGR